MTYSVVVSTSEILELVRLPRMLRCWNVVYFPGAERAVGDQRTLLSASVKITAQLATHMDTFWG